ncbi:TIGR03943 family putative permease subunit [Actinokineospora pegani]|uniref:TIGR03943 family putative permease subunit n=1 Tax=Actinokineospora pegani TaxID=2654637 RepID=UPI0012E9E158|nr:TIGR03943 family protein [Actinokineospora pegani]
MRRETQNILLLLIGGALLKIALTGTYLRYVKPAHQPWLIGAAVVMVVLAAIAIVHDVRAARPGAEPPHDLHDPDHEHNHSARSSWLLLLPVLSIFLVLPPALGADSVRRAPTASTTTAESALYPALPPDDLLAITMADFSSRAAFDRANSLNGRRVLLTGFIVQDADRVYLARLSIACCAADAFPVRVLLTGNAAAGLSNDTWVRVTGTLVAGSATKENEYVPALDPAALTRITEPENPYEG